MTTIERLSFESPLRVTFVNMEIQLDVLPFGFSWSVESTDDGSCRHVRHELRQRRLTRATSFRRKPMCATTGCYELSVSDLFGNGLHYPPGGWYCLDR